MRVARVIGVTAVVVCVLPLPPLHAQSALREAYQWKDSWQHIDPTVPFRLPDNAFSVARGSLARTSRVCRDTDRDRRFGLGAVDPATGRCIIGQFGVPGAAVFDVLISISGYWSSPTRALPMSQPPFGVGPSYGEPILCRATA